MLCNVVLVSAIHQHESSIGIYIYIYVPFLLNLPPISHPISRLSHNIGLSSPHHTVNFRWLSNFTDGNVNVTMILPQFVPSSPSPAVCISLAGQFLFTVPPGKSPSFLKNIFTGYTLLHWQVFLSALIGHCATLFLLLLFLMVSVLLFDSLFLSV